jgi:hypothetical protein
VGGANGTKTFVGKFTKNGTWTNSANESFEFRNGFENNGSFSSGWVTYSFGTNNQTISGSNSITIAGNMAILNKLRLR